MAKIKNVSGDNRTLSAAAGGALVLKNATVEVPDEDVYNYTQQDIWEPFDAAAKAAHEAGEAAYQERLAAHEAEHRALLGIPEDLDEETEESDEPADTAPRKPRGGKNTTTTQEG